MHLSSMRWLREIRFFVVGLLLLNSLWEVIQLPLYTIWGTATPKELLFAILHCTVADVLIGTGCLIGTLVAEATEAWPNDRFGTVAVLTIVAGESYTLYSEWHNTVVLHSWTYASTMPTIANIGLAPLAQWLVIPSLLFWRMHHRVTGAASTL